MKYLLGLFLICAQARAETFHERAEAMLSAYNDNSYGSIAVHLKRHEQLEWCSKRLQELLAAGPTGDMCFDVHPVTAVAYLDQSGAAFTGGAPGFAAALWKTYMPYRGDTRKIIFCSITRRFI